MGMLMLLTPFLAGNLKGAPPLVKVGEKPGLPPFPLTYQCASARLSLRPPENFPLFAGALPRKTSYRAETAFGPLLLINSGAHRPSARWSVGVSPP